MGLSPVGAQRPAPHAAGFVIASLGAVVAVATDAVPAWPGVPHLVALPPLDLAADLRIVAAKAASPGAALATTAAAVGVRAMLLAAYLGSVRRHLGFALRFNLVALPLAGLAAALGFAAQAALYAWFSWAGLAVTVALFVLFGGAPWDGSHRMWPPLGQWKHRLGAMPVLAAYPVLLAVLGAVAPRGTGVIALVPVSAGLSWWAARRLAAPRRPHRWLAAATTMAGAAVLAAALTAPVRGSIPGPPRQRPGSLFLVPGVATASGRGAMYRLDPRQLGYSCAQTFYFSYAGPGPGTAQGEARCPIRTGARYSGRDTGRPLKELATSFTEQLSALPGPVVVVTHSQGAWVAWEALARGNRPLPVGALVMLGPFAHTLAPYPPPGTNGRGYAGGVALRALVGLARGASTTSFAPDAPLTRELHATPAAVDALFARPLPPAVVAAAVESRWDLALGLNRWPPRVRRTCPVPTTHTGLATSPAAMRVARAVLDGHILRGCPSWLDWIPRGFAPFSIPSRTL